MVQEPPSQGKAFLVSEGTMQVAKGGKEISIFTQLENKDVHHLKI